MITNGFYLFGSLDFPSDKGWKYTIKKLNFAVIKYDLYVQSNFKYGLFSRMHFKVL